MGELFTEQELERLSIKTFGGILVGMGLSGSALQIAVVALVVYVLYLGIEAFCEEG